MADDFYASYPVTGGNGVTSINGLNGALTLIAGSNITITPSGNTLTISSTGGGGANTALSNLTTVAFNADLVPDGDETRRIGSASAQIDTLFASTIYYANGNPLSVTSEGDIIVNSATDMELVIDSGHLKIEDPSLTGASVGYVWTLTNVDGSGEWTAPSAAGANTALSNLASTAINVSLIPAVDGAINIGTASLQIGTTYTHFQEMYDPSAYLYLDNNAGQYIQAYVIDPAQSINGPFPVNSAIEAAGDVAFFSFDGGDVALFSRNAGAGSGEVFVGTGDSGVSNSGSVTLRTGTSTGTRGNISLNNWFLVQLNNDIPTIWGNDIPMVVVDINNADVLAAGGGGMLFNGNNNQGNLILATRDGTGADSNVRTSDLYILTGAGNAGDNQPTGDINLSTGTASGSGLRGRINLDGEHVSINSSSLKLYNFNSDPTNAIEGDIYYNNVAKKIKLYNGTTWETVTSV